MSYALFKNFRLNFLIVCLDCSNEKEICFLLGDFFNLVRGFVKRYENPCKYICDRCLLEIFNDLKKLFKPSDIREIYNGILLL